MSKISTALKFLPKNHYERVEFIYKNKSAINSRDFSIVKLRFITGYSQKEVAWLLNISTTRINQIENRAVKKLFIKNYGQRKIPKVRPA